MFFSFFFSSRRRHTRCALVTGVQTCALPISFGALTDREREVLSLVAVGGTNRQIAAALGISEHTVDRHLSNIFDKLAVTSRTAAGAFAHKNKLVGGATDGQIRLNDQRHDVPKRGDETGGKHLQNNRRSEEQRKKTE